MGRYELVAFYKPIPKGRRFEQIFMFRDLPDLHADGSGDLFEIGLLVLRHLNGVFWTLRRFLSHLDEAFWAAARSRIGVRSRRGTIVTSRGSQTKLCPLTAKTGVRVP
jgi:hypothetical protein